jgi:hypothetical protein
MRDLIGVLYILAVTGGDIMSPPSTSQIISHLIMAYYSHKYTKAAQTPTAVISPNSSSLFYSQPATVILPDGSFDASPCREHVVATPAPAAAELIHNRKQTTVAYDLLEMLR